eukprot:gene38166-96_t
MAHDAALGGAAVAGGDGGGSCVGQRAAPTAWYGCIDVSLRVCAVHHHEFSATKEAHGAGACSAYVHVPWGLMGRTTHTHTQREGRVGGGRGGGGPQGEVMGVARCPRARAACRCV